MDLHFNTSLANGYKSTSQIARVLTEDWLARNIFCPVCGCSMMVRAEPNAPVKDYVCNHCKAQYELKSKRTNSDKFMASVADGVYHTMIRRIKSLENPSFFFMHYDRNEVNNLIIVPKCFFTPAIIEKRRPLSGTARRAGWEGCNIIMKCIPTIAKIPIVSNGHALPINKVVSQYHRVFNLQTKSVESRGWLMDTLQVIDRLEDTFSLNQMYAFVEELKAKHPKNHHIHDKIRQQLQFLRDKGIIEFRERGCYRKVR